MPKFGEEYKRLNDAQREAVDNIDGPMLVVAGPGTGKTQLLGMRVANILRQTDAAPPNILCLTFTDNAARNMRERLESIIGQPAYHVAIHTFHSFGGEIFNRYPDFFTARQMIQQVDELGSYELLSGIFEDMPHSNPLSVKAGDEFILLKDTLQIISWLKQNAVSPNQLHTIIEANQKQISKVEQLVAKVFAVPTSPAQLPSYKKLLEMLQKEATSQSYLGFPDYLLMPANELKEAIERSPTNGRYAPPITQWRNSWLGKNAAGGYVFKDSGRNLRKMHAVANAYQELNEVMAAQGLYDFDDMVIEALQALEASTELKYNLQEQYQYILVDEFQDTNKAQLRMLYTLGDNLIFEHRPNIMAVGDDDQAIFAFQGAEVSNMADFVNKYRQPKIIILTLNYRAPHQLIDCSYVAAEQLTDRLQAIIPTAKKKLVSNADHKLKNLLYAQLPSELAQYHWVAAQIEGLIKGGLEPQNIAVLAPRHKYLERLVPYLGEKHIPIAYERRENILDAPLIIELIDMVGLVDAIAKNRQDQIDELLAKILGFEFWGIEPELLIDLAQDCYKKNQSWLKVTSKHKNQQLKEIALWFTALARRSHVEPLEYIIDKLCGVTPTGLDSDQDELPAASGRLKVVSPYKNYYFNDARLENATDSYLTLLGQLSTLRQRLRQWKPDKTLFAADLVNFVNLHRQAKLKIIDTNPHTQTTNAVQVMTAYKAKGLEFDAVFLVNAQDEVWGPTAKSGSSKVSLPKNLPIAPAGNSDNDKLRLLFVALSRAKSSLFITGYSHDLGNKLSLPLSYLSDTSKLIQRQDIEKPGSTNAVEILATDWAYRFRQVIAKKPALFEPILSNYKLSVTHLNNFIDVLGGGPQTFFLHNLLRFPHAITAPAAYGDAIHKTLQQAHLLLRGGGKLPSISKIDAIFNDNLARKHLLKTEHIKYKNRGLNALKLYFTKRADNLLPTDVLERGFNNDGVVINGAKLSGKIDKIRFITPFSAVVYDFKTGSPSDSWQGKDAFEKIKLHKYMQQLMFYKLLVENSASYGGKVSLNHAELEFIEADEAGQLVDNLVLEFSQNDLSEFSKLVTAVWQHIMNLDFPDISGYKYTLPGIIKFEQDLKEGKI